MVWIHSRWLSQYYCQAFCHADSISKVCLFLGNCWTNKTYKIFEIFGWYYKIKTLKIDHSFQLNSTSSFRESTSTSQPSHISRLLSVGLAQRCLLFLFWYMRCEEYKAGSSHAYIIIFFYIFFETPHDLLTQMHLSTECGQNKTKPKHTVYIKYLHFVSALFLFCFCQLNVEPHPHPACWPKKKPLCLHQC